MADMRIGDAERERTAARLADEVGTGRLTLAEYEERVDRAYAAHTAAELAAVTADLPPDASRTAPSGNEMSRTARSWHDTSRTALSGHHASRAALSGRAGAAIWAPWVATTVICLVIWAATSLGAGHPLYFWPMWVGGPWGVMLALGTLSGRALCTKALPR